MRGEVEGRPFAPRQQRAANDDHGEEPCPELPAVQQDLMGVEITEGDADDHAGQADDDLHHVEIVIDELVGPDILRGL